MKLFNIAPAMNHNVKIFNRIASGQLGALTFLTLCILLFQFPGHGQNYQYEQFSPEQKRLFASYTARSHQSKRSQMSAAARFSSLTKSERSTFASITNALANTELTDANGKSLGEAIGLVQAIELIAGERAGKGSDEQFRLYVKVRRDAVSVLERSVEFERGRNNTKFHKGYPQNFRQVGSTPTLQFSFSEDGGRADIDVDYRSSGFPASLFNGHLTASNSDVRAPGNYLTHVLRWPGLIDFWRIDLDSVFQNFEKTQLKPLDAEFLKGLSSPGVSDVEKISLSMEEFLQLWIVKRDVDRAVNFVGGKFLTCPAEGSADDPKFEMRLRVLFYNLLKAANRGLGKRERLAGLIQAVERREKWLETISESRSQYYSLMRVAAGKQLQFACHERSRVAEAPSKGEPSYYVTTFGIFEREKLAGTMSLIWTFDAGQWRIQGFDASPADDKKGMK